MNVYCFFILLSIIASESARILVIVPTPAYSHNKFARTLYKELASRGHQVVAFNTFNSNDKTSKNLNELDLKPQTYQVHNYIGRSGFIVLNEMATFFSHLCHKLYTNDHMKNLLTNSSEKFDLFMVEWNVAPCFSILKKHFNVPMIGFRPNVLRPEGHDYIANPTNPSYLRLTHFNFYITFYERLYGFLFAIYWRLHYNFVTIPQSQSIVDFYFPENNLSVRAIEKEVEVILLNTHPVVNGPRPLVPAAIEIGMMHVGRSKDQLDQMLQSYLDNSKNGFVLFNLGSLLTDHIYTNDTLKVIFETFQNLPYNVIWKTNKNTEDLINLAKNVKVVKWIPQEALLAHPNIKCFISHVGLHSLQEVIYYRVPIIAVPFLFDQHQNAHRVEALGIGERIDFQELSSVIFTQSIITVSEHKRYKFNIQRVHNLVMDRQIEPMEKAMWWIEYVIKHKGSPFIKSDAVYMDWFSYLMLDTILLLTTLIVAVVYLTILIAEMTLKFIAGQFVRKIKTE